MASSASFFRLSLMASSASLRPRSSAKIAQANRTNENNGGAFGELIVVATALAKSVFGTAASTPDSVGVNIAAAAKIVP